jgi:hypothetical protein
MRRRLDVCIIFVIRFLFGSVNAISSPIEGAPIKCLDSDGKVYRFSGGKRRYYPNDSIADSWDRNWRVASFIDCATIPKGPNMPPRNGAPIKCIGDNASTVYRSIGALNTFNLKKFNVAKGKSTSQSSTGWSGSSARAVDGNTNGVWSGNSVQKFLENKHY